LAATSLNLEAHSKDLRINRSRDSETTFFVTKSLQPKKPVLNVVYREKIVSALAFGVEKERIHLRSFVVMPDHWHALLAVRQPWTLSRFMHAMMTSVGRETGAMLTKEGAKWQDGFYDTKIRTAKQFEYITAYIEGNPVAKGLVTDPKEWKESSAFLTSLITEPWPLTYD
jgi:putative transposase